ncbi:MAG: hypothetical protein HY695_19580 [Deltaproteobacteria bacterium]|nr:hypothetical protein [Deltaproteobacteria bacterium]
MIHLDETRWYVAYTKPCKESLAQFYLRLKGIEAFFPQLALPEEKNNLRRVVPLFPNYLFVRIQITKQFHFVNWSPGIKRLVGVEGVPAPLDDAVVRFLMQQASPQGVIQGRSNLRVGQEVRIKSGPFQGLVGIIQESPDSRERVKVLLRLLNRPIRVEIPVRFVESGWVIGRPELHGASLRSNC